LSVLDPAPPLLAVTRTSDLHIHRGWVIAGLFYRMHGMHVGRARTLRIAPHLACGERGVPGVIPTNALLTIEVTVLSHRSDADYCVTRWPSTTHKSGNRVTRTATMLSIGAR